MRTALLVLLLCGCQASLDGLTVVHVTAATPLEAVARLSIEIGDGTHRVHDDVGTAGISLPPERTIAIDTPASFSATLHVSVVAYDAAGLRLGAGAADVEVRSGQRADVTVTLTPARTPPLPPLAEADTPGLGVVAGVRGGPGFAEQRGSDARFRQPHAVVCNDTGRLCYLSDTDNHVVRRLDLDTGALTIVAGQVGVAKHTDGMGGGTVHSPTGLALDPGGRFLYIAERDAHVIASLDLMTTQLQVFIGTVDQPGSFEGGFLNATFDSPDAIIADPVATYSLYVADTGNHTVRRVQSGFVGPISSLFGGTPGTAGWKDASAAGDPSLFHSPAGMAIFGGFLYVADGGNHRVRTLDLGTAPGSRSATTTVAGSDVAGGSDGVGGTLRTPTGLAVLGSVLFIADAAGSTLRSLDLANLAIGLSTPAGLDLVPGIGDGIGAAARFISPAGLCSSGTTLLLADPAGQALRAFEPATASVSTRVGRGSGAGMRDGVGEAAAFSHPRAIITDDAGHAFVADSDNAAIRSIDLATGTVMTLAGKLGEVGHADGAGADARFDEPWALAYGDGALWVSERRGQVVRRVDPLTGATTTLAGGYLVADHLDGAGSDARFDRPIGLARDGDALYVLEGGSTLRSIDLLDPAHAVRTRVGEPGNDSHVDGPLAVARLEAPTSLAGDRQGRLFVSEATGTIRLVDLGLGVVFTFAGAYQQPGAIDSCGVTAHFRGITHLGFDYPGARLLVSDGELVRRVRLDDACVATLAGVVGQQAVQLGAPPASLNHPAGAARDVDGSLLVVDEAENVVLRLWP